MTRLTAAMFFFTQIFKLPVDLGMIDQLIDDNSEPSFWGIADHTTGGREHIRAFNFRIAPNQPSIVVERDTQ